MEALILTLPTIILLAIPMLLLAFIGIEVAELLSKIERKKKQKVKIAIGSRLGLLEGQNFCISDTKVKKTRCQILN